jgi:hypothetical protein
MKIKCIQYSILYSISALLLMKYLQRAMLQDKDTFKGAVS